MTDDYISRQAAIDRLESWLKVDGYSEGELNMLKAAIYELRSFPPADVKSVRTGRCIWCDSPFRIEYYWIDRNGNTASFQDEERHIVATGIANFCPNCGADMRGESDD